MKALLAVVLIIAGCIVLLGLVALMVLPYVPVFIGILLIILGLSLLSK